MSSRQLWRKRSVDLFSNESDSDDSETAAYLRIRKRRRRTLSLQPKKVSGTANKEHISPDNRTFSTKKMMPSLDEVTPNMALIKYSLNVKEFVEGILQKQSLSLVEISDKDGLEATAIMNADENVACFDQNKPESTKQTDSPRTFWDQENEEFEEAFEVIYDVLDFFNNYLKDSKEECLTISNKYILILQKEQDDYIQAARPIEEILSFFDNFLLKSTETDTEKVSSQSLILSATKEKPHLKNSNDKKLESESFLQKEQDDYIEAICPISKVLSFFESFMCKSSKIDTEKKVSFQNSSLGNPTEAKEQLPPKTSNKTKIGRNCFLSIEKEQDDYIQASRPISEILAFFEKFVLKSFDTDTEKVSSRKSLIKIMSETKEDFAQKNKNRECPSKSVLIKYSEDCGRIESSIVELLTFFDNFFKDKEEDRLDKRADLVSVKKTRNQRRQLKNVLQIESEDYNHAVRPMLDALAFFESTNGPIILEGTEEVSGTKNILEQINDDYEKAASPILGVLSFFNEYLHISEPVSNSNNSKLHVDDCLKFQNLVEHYDFQQTASTGNRFNTQYSVESEERDFDEAVEPIFGVLSFFENCFGNSLRPNVLEEENQIFSKAIAPVLDVLEFFDNCFKNTAGLHLLNLTDHQRAITRITNLLNFLSKEIQHEDHIETTHYQSVNMLDTFYSFNNESDIIESQQFEDIEDSDMISTNESGNIVIKRTSSNIESDNQLPKTSLVNELDNDGDLPSSTSTPIFENVNNVENCGKTQKPITEPEDIAPRKQTFVADLDLILKKQTVYQHSPDGSELEGAQCEPQNTDCDNNGTQTISINSEIYLESLNEVTNVPQRLPHSSHEDSFDPVGTKEGGFYEICNNRSEFRNGYEISEPNEYTVYDLTKKDKSFYSQKRLHIEDHGSSIEEESVESTSEKRLHIEDHGSSIEEDSVEHFQNEIEVEPGEKTNATIDSFLGDLELFFDEHPIDLSKKKLPESPPNLTDFLSQIDDILQEPIPFCDFPRMGGQINNSDGNHKVDDFDEFSVRSGASKRTLPKIISIEELDCVRRPLFTDQNYNVIGRNSLEDLVCDLNIHHERVEAYEKVNINEIYDQPEEDEKHFDEPMVCDEVGMQTLDSENDLYEEPSPTNELDSSIASETSTSGEPESGTTASSVISLTKKPGTSESELEGFPSPQRPSVHNSPSKDFETRVLRSRVLAKVNEEEGSDDSISEHSYESDDVASSDESSDHSETDLSGNEAENEIKRIQTRSRCSKQLEIAEPNKDPVVEVEIEPKEKYTPEKIQRLDKQCFMDPPSYEIEEVSNFTETDIETLSSGNNETSSKRSDNENRVDEGLSENPLERTIFKEEVDIDDYVYFTDEELEETIMNLENDATIYVGGLDDKVTETLMWELFVQGGPVDSSLISNENLEESPGKSAKNYNEVYNDCEVQRENSVDSVMQELFKPNDSNEDNYQILTLAENLLTFAQVIHKQCMNINDDQIGDTTSTVRHYLQRLTQALSSSNEVQETQTEPQNTASKDIQTDIIEASVPPQVKTASKKIQTESSSGKNASTQYDQKWTASKKVQTNPFSGKNASTQYDLKRFASKKIQTNNFSGKSTSSQYDLEGPSIGTQTNVEVVESASVEIQTDEKELATPTQEEVLVPFLELVKTEVSEFAKNTTFVKDDPVIINLVDYSDSEDGSESMKNIFKAVHGPINSEEIEVTPDIIIKDEPAVSNPGSRSCSAKSFENGVFELEKIVSNYFEKSRRAPFLGDQNNKLNGDDGEKGKCIKIKRSDSEKDTLDSESDSVESVSSLDSSTVLNGESSSNVKIIIDKEIKKTASTISDLQSPLSLKSQPVTSFFENKAEIDDRSASESIDDPEDSYIPGLSFHENVNNALTSTRNNLDEDSSSIAPLNFSAKRRRLLISESSSNADESASSSEISECWKKSATRNASKKDSSELSSDEEVLSDLVYHDSEATFVDTFRGKDFILTDVSSDDDNLKKKKRTKTRRIINEYHSDSEEDESFNGNLIRKKPLVRSGSHEDSGQFSKHDESVDELSEKDYDEEEDREIRRLINLNNLERTASSRPSQKTHNVTRDKPKKKSSRSPHSNSEYSDTSYKEDMEFERLNEARLQERLPDQEAFNEMCYLKELNEKSKNELLITDSSESGESDDESNILATKLANRKNFRSLSNSSDSDSSTDKDYTEIKDSPNIQAEKDGDSKIISLLTTDDESINLTNEYDTSHPLIKSEPFKRGYESDTSENELTGSATKRHKYNFRSPEEIEVDRKNLKSLEQLLQEYNDGTMRFAQNSIAQPNEDLDLSSKQFGQVIASLSISDSDISSMVDNTEDNRRSQIRKELNLLRAAHRLPASRTKHINTEEHRRITRLTSKEAKLKREIKKMKRRNKNFDPEKELILDFDSKQKTLIRVKRRLVDVLKDHQKDGIRFMYDSVYGNINQMDRFSGSGCILAHCMGLGKTLQLIALIDTLVSYKELRTRKILVLCPKSTVLNWTDEIANWLGKQSALDVFIMGENGKIFDKLKALDSWGEAAENKAGILILGYEAFRNLVLYSKYKKRDVKNTESAINEIQRKINIHLTSPGPDLVICDEGHVIKNKGSAISIAVSTINTPRRIVLTGTPMQNNLHEYFAMVDFIKPGLLGTERQFGNNYAGPIRGGQHADSSREEIKLMKQKSFILHKKLQEFIQRKEVSLLKTFLPMKFEYVLFIPLTEIQNKLYEQCLKTEVMRFEAKNATLLTDYTTLRKVWTHPKVLERASQNSKYYAKNARKAKTENSAGNSREWWTSLISNTELNSCYSSNKIIALFDILRLCSEVGDKCLIFSSFVAVLNMVEDFMKRLHCKDPSMAKFISQKKNTYNTWENGKDYYRIDGATPKNVRQKLITNFNDRSNKRARVFLISAKAGGQGINLFGANRVIILDTSWNPSLDQQNIFRIFRLGQDKSCYIYRLLSMGTMEEKVYSRSVTKQAMSFRVCDEKNIDRHYSMAELAELYVLTKPNYDEQPVHTFPQDIVLKELLTIHPKIIFKYHEHDSLLENKVEEELTEQERLEAWNAFRKEQIKLTKEEENADQEIPSRNNSNVSAEGQLSGALDSFISEPVLDLSPLPTTVDESSSNIANEMLNIMKRRSMEFPEATSSKKSKLN